MSSRPVAPPVLSHARSDSSKGQMPQTRPGATARPGGNPEQQVPWLLRDSSRSREESKDQPGVTARLAEATLWWSQGQVSPPSEEAVHSSGQHAGGDAPDRVGVLPVGPGLA